MGVLTDGRSWEFYMFESIKRASVPADESDETTSGPSVPRLKQKINPLTNLYGSGGIAIVDNGSATNIFGVTRSAYS